MTYSQFKHDQLIFMIGLPGSGWSKMDNLLRCCSKFKANKSDYEGRWESYGNNRLYREHKGAFWDPGMEYGEGFDDLRNHTKETFVEQCLGPYTDINEHDNYFVKSHFFAEKHNLEWLDTNFPNNKMIFVLRPKEYCDDRWLSTMTFAKNYPKYTAWQVVEDPDEEAGSHHEANVQSMKSTNERHDLSMRSFIRRASKQTIIISPTRSVLDKMGMVWDQDGRMEFAAYIKNYAVSKSLNISPAWDTSFCLYNCDGILF
jgi:hypothetical protein